MMKKKLSYIAVVSILIGMGMLTSCSVNDNPGKEVVSQKADLVVYGKIFTSEGNQVVEAFAVKDGKYADFLLVDKDVLTCPVTEIHTAKPAATYFEGKQVFVQSRR